MKRVAIIIETISEDGRGILRGIIRYLNERGPWDLHLVLNNFIHAERMQRWTGDGVLARTANPAILQRIWQLDIPMVLDADWPQPPPQRSAPAPRFPWESFPNWVPMAVQHLTSRGLKHLAYFGYYDREDYGRNANVTAACSERKVTAHLFDPDAYEGTETERLGRWLTSLPKPVGVVSASDERGIAVLTTCQSLGISVPDEVAILGAGNDFFLCSLSTPRMSSIQLAFEDVGYHAAEMLSCLMQGKPRPASFAFPPPRIVPRGSTDLLVCDDAVVKQATRLIRDRDDFTGGVGSLVRQLGVSRRTLERRFFAALGRSPGDEMRRRRVERARSLLEHTELSAGEIARRCGFAAPARLTEAMRRELGVGPADYRKRNKARG